MRIGFLAMLVSVSPLLAEEEIMKYPVPGTVVARVSYFLPESSSLQNVSYNGGAYYQVTGTVPMYDGDLFALRGLNFWWAVDYFYKSERSTRFNNRGHIQMVPITAGLKYIYPAYNFRPYLGAGFKYYFVKIHNSSPFLQENIRRNGLGGTIEIGLLTFLARYLVMDLFLTYSFKQFNSYFINSRNVINYSFNVGGLNIGGGLGLKF